ncbi:MAG: plasmid maintenance system killer family protein [Magnetovibrio sp.]|nr:plasmid maintenance system killer family protein [Magnetovibrio sp.]
MIRSFHDRETERVFRREHSRKLPGNIQRRAQRKLAILHSAKSLADLAAIPGNDLEKKKGDRKGQHCIRVNDQWRICFKWKNGDAYSVGITDYH